MLVGVVETWVVGQLGLPSLAALSLVFPSIILMQNMASGSLGGSVAALVSQALGRGRPVEASVITYHGLLIGGVLGAVFLVLYLAFGRWLYGMLGGRDEVLDIATRYSFVVMGTLPVMWWSLVMSAVLRGTGNMRLPARITLLAAAAQIALGLTLGLGLGPLPSLGMVGVALAQVTPMLAAAAYLYWHVSNGLAPVRLRIDGRRPRLQAAVFIAILRPAGIAFMNPLLAMLIIMLIGRLVAQHGVEALAAFGIGTRLEMLLLNIIWAVGVASVPMIGMSLGRGEVARSRRVAWTACTVAALLMLSVGWALALFPDAWLRLFTTDPATLEAGRSYLRWVGPCLVFFGIGSSLYYSAQGAGRILGPVIASASRLVVVILGGLLLSWMGSSVSGVFSLIGFAMVTFGLGAVLAVRNTRWDASPARTV